MAEGQTSEPNDWKPVEPADWQSAPTEHQWPSRLGPAPLRAAASGAHASGPAPSAFDKLLAPRYLNSPAGDPSTLRGYGQHAAEALRGIGGGIKGFIATPFPGTKNNPVNWNPVTQFKKDFQGIKEWNELRQKDPDYAWGSMLGPMLFTHTVAKMLTPAGMVPKLARGAGVDPAYIEPIVDDLRAAAKGDTPRTVGDFVRVAGKAQAKLNDEFDQAMGPYSHWRGNLPGVNGRFPLAEAIRQLKNKMPQITAADRAERTFIDHAAAEYEKPIGLKELDLKRIQANNRLTAYYDKNDVSQYATESRNAQIAVDKAVADWVRDNVYPEMDTLSGKPPGYFRNLKSRVGNLMNAKSQAKEFAEKVHRQSAVERGSTPLERVRPGGAISARGGVHGYLSNVHAMFKAPDPEAGANAAVRAGFGLSQRRPNLVKASPLSLPLSAVVGASKPYQNPTDEYQGIEPQQ